MVLDDSSGRKSRNWKGLQQTVENMVNKVEQFDRER